MYPSGEEVSVATGVLREDASRWRQMAAELREASANAQRLGLSARELSFIGMMVGLTSIYDDIHERMVAYMEQGAANFENLAEALETAADGYDADERAGVHRLREIY